MENKNTMIKVYKLGAEWCGPCRMMKPTINSLMEKYNVEGSDVEIIDVDIDADNALAEEHGVRSIPTTLFMVNDEFAIKRGGVLLTKEIEEIIQQLKTDTNGKHLQN